MIGGNTLRELVELEILQRRQEGCIVPDYTVRLAQADRAELERIYEELDALTVSPDHPFTEPVELADILLCSAGCTYRRTPDKDLLSSQMYGAWLGRIIGCILGKPHERAPFGAGDGAADGWAYIRQW